MSKIRQSNIELLRIILMLMIVINHIISHGVLDYNEIIGNTLIFYRMIIAFVVPAVISFVLISGYFSIHGSLFGGAKFWLQSMELLLVSILISLFACHVVTMKDFALSIFSPVSESHGLWFIPAYFTLYCVSPFLNSWLNDVSKKKLAIAIVLLMSGLCSLGYLINMSFFSGIWLFVLLYMIGWWIKRYDVPLLSKLSISKLIGVYVVLCLMNLLVYFLFQKYLPSINAYSYKNPITILSGIVLFLIFMNIKMSFNKWINVLAIGAFPVYILHENVWMRSFWSNYVHNVYCKYSFLGLFLLILLMVPILYVLVTLAEKLRLLIHKKYLFPQLEKIKSLIK